MKKYLRVILVDEVAYDEILRQGIPHKFIKAVRDERDVWAV